MTGMPLTKMQRSSVLLLPAWKGNCRVTVRRLLLYRLTSVSVSPWAGLKYASLRGMFWSMIPWRSTSSVPRLSISLANR